MRSARISSCERRNGDGQVYGDIVMGTAEERSVLARWPIGVPPDWLERVNRDDEVQELESLRRSVQRGRPFSPPEWKDEIAKKRAHN
jgi:hypothetical protein